VSRAAALCAPLLALALAGCDKFEFLADNPVPPIATRVLFHRGSGNLTTPPPNTLEAMLYGSQYLDGVEMDLEITSDGVVWLGHDNEVHTCDGSPSPGCFQELTDAQIDVVGISTCGGVRYYDRLDAVLAGMAATYPTKVMSLDIKGQFCKVLLGDGIRDAAKTMAEEVVRLVRLHGVEGRVITESSQDSFTETIVSSGAGLYPLVVSLGDVDGPLTHAAQLGAAGISMKYDPADPSIEPLTPSLVEGIHRKGFRITVWTVNGAADAQAVWATHPDVIQTDDAGFYGYLPPLP
jgi:glycerophosphoryl diester phosphodiesterase